MLQGAEWAAGQAAADELSVHGVVGAQVLPVNLPLLTDEAIRG